MGRGKGRLLEREAPKPGVDVGLEDLGRLWHADGPDHRPPRLGDALEPDLRLVLVLDQDDAHAKREQHARWVTPDGHAVLLEHPLLALQVLEVTAKPVTDVSVLGQDAEGLLLAHPADQDLRASRLDRAR